MAAKSQEQIELYRWRVLVEHVCDCCGCGFSSYKPDPKYCSQECYLEAGKEALAARAKELWKSPTFVSKIQAARKQAGYPDPQRPAQVIRRRLRAAAKNAVHRCLRHFSRQKEGRTLDLVGYTPDMLREHIEALFTQGMSWENYGAWEIDHKRPISKFGDDAALSDVNALSNLQPLWKSDNRSKSNSER